MSKRSTLISGNNPTAGWGCPYSPVWQIRGGGLAKWNNWSNITWQVTGISTVIISIATTQVCSFQRPALFWPNWAPQPTCFASPSRSHSQHGSSPWNQWGKNNGIQREKKKSKQVSISGPSPCARHFFHSFLIYSCAMKGMVLAEHLAHCFSLVRSVFSYW